MNEQEYRRIVRQIRWSDPKRAEIEAALSEPQSADSTDPEWHDAEKHRIEITHTSAKRTEAIIMKQAKSRRLLLAGIAAAILATGGAIAAIAGHGFKRIKTTDITHSNGTVLHLTDEENIPYYSYPTLLDEAATMGSFYSTVSEPAEMVTPTESGCFYYQKSVDNGKENYILMYTDFASGKSVPVCAKPNCKHDGNAYCTASTTVYAPSFLEYHDGYLYSMTTKFLHPEDRKLDSTDFSIGSYYESPDYGELMKTIPPEDCRQVLLRYSPDGTQIEELHDFGSGKGNGRCLFHRGYIWCIVQLQSSGENSENSITNDKSSFVNGGWQLWGYELATGKTICLCDGKPKPDVNHVNSSPRDFAASGDYLYFTRGLLDWSGSQNALCSISLLTGKEQTVLPSDNYSGTMTKKDVICKDKPKQVNSRTIEHFSVMDLVSGEKTESKPIFDQNYEIDGKKYQILSTAALMDDQYIIAYAYELSESAGNVPLGLDKDSKDKTVILDHDLNVVKITDKHLNSNIRNLETVNAKEGLYKISMDVILFEYQGMIYMHDFSTGLSADTGMTVPLKDAVNSYTIKRFPVSDLITDEEPHYETVCSYEY